MTTQRCTSFTNRMNYVLPKPNPFLISEVLENILNQSEWSFQDLRNLRLVCKLWCNVSLPLWRSSATLCLLQEKRPTTKKSGILASKFAKILLDEGDSDSLQLRRKPYSKFKLFNWKIDGSFPELKRLWDSFGHHIKELTLEKCNFHDCHPMHFKHILYIGSPNLSHLVLLSTDIQSRFLGGLSDALESSRNANISTLEVMQLMPFNRLVRNVNICDFDNFLSTLPQLKTLRMAELFQGEHFFQFQERGRNRELLDDMRENNFLRRVSQNMQLQLQLRHLDIMHWNLSPVSYTDIYIPLRRLQLPLESLSVTLTCTRQENDEFRKLVKAHASTLKVLKVFVPPFYRAQSVICSFAADMNMPSLIEELELWGNVVDDFDFLLGMPELKRLKMSFDCFDKRKYIENTYSTQESYEVRPEHFWKVSPFQNPNLRMQHLTEFQFDLKFQDLEIEFFAKSMPNLRSFKSVFDSSTFPVFLREWRNSSLEELYVLYGSDLDDDAICGSDGEGQDCPNISWLQELRHFTLEAYCDMGRLTDKSAQEGFLKLKLCSLKICVSVNFSDAMEERLKESIHRVEVFRNYGDHKKECCARLDFKKKAFIPFPKVRFQRRPVGVGKRSKQ